MREKQKPAAQGRKRASSVALAGERDSRKNTPNTVRHQVRTEREIYRGLTFVGVVRETSEGHFVAVIGGNLIGSFATIAQAADKIIELARAGGGR